MALHLLAHRLKQAGITLRVSAPDGAFWSAADADPASDQHIVDVTFVDDEAIILIASSPAALDLAMWTMLDILLVTFRLAHLELNWSPGKSECILKYRGKRAVQAREQWRRADGTLAIPVRGDILLRIVQDYKHLGSFVSAIGNGASPRNISHRTSSAMAAYAPLSAKVFGR